MNKLDVLLKCVYLLYRESLLNVTPEEDSKDLVKNILNTIREAGNYSITGGSSNIIEELRTFIYDLSNNPDDYDESNIIDSLAVILKEKESTIRQVEKSIKTQMTPAGLKKSVLSLRNNLRTYHREQEVKDIVGKTSYKLKMNKTDGETIDDIVSGLIVNLEALTSKTKLKDPGVMDELDVNQEDSMEAPLKRVKEKADDSGKLMTGWKELNTATQGGFRRGEFAIINAMQHDYKSGFTQSIAMQLPRCNKPVNIGVDKKPLIIYISFEDDAEIFTEFMYRYLYFNETGKSPDLTTITEAEISKYVKEKLSINGYHVKLLRVNPNEWTYKDLFNKIISYEADGYEIHACLLDYLAKLPTTGCINTGPTGTDLRDLFNRTRNFLSSKRIFGATPHQMSSDAKQLIRNDISAANLVKEVAGKGYTEMSKQLDQVVDLELYIHRACIKRKWYLTVQRGKHRTPGILEDDKKYFMLEFPKGAPIPENINDDDHEEAFGEIENSSEDEEIDI